MEGEYISQHIKGWQLWGVVRGGGIEQKRKGLMDMDNCVVIVVGEGWVKVEEGIRGINGNGKNTIQNKFKKEQSRIISTYEETQDEIIWVKH